MEVILLEDVKSLGKKGQIVKINDGYARNYLFPKKLAQEANSENRAKLQSRNDSKQFKKDTEKAKAEEIANKLKGIMLKVKVKAGENGKIFGGVTAKEISDGLKKDYNIEIDKKKIMLNETLKLIGTVTVDIKLYEGVIGKLKVDIIAA